jgi:hypothetical protein
LTLQKAPRLGAAAIIIAAVALNAVLPTRYRIGPEWLSSVAAVVMIVPMIVDRLTQGNPFWRRVERIAMFTGVGLALVFNTCNLVDVVYNLVTNSRAMSPEPLFYTSVAIWAGNMFIFTLIYWLIDRGGPDARASGDVSGYADFDFPAMDDPDKVPPNWHPGIVDYLFLGFTTSTAFSPTEAMPLTARAKILVIVQSSISLITIAVVAARTINILQ